MKHGGHDILKTSAILEVHPAQDDFVSHDKSHNLSKKNRGNVYTPDKRRSIELEMCPSHVKCTLNVVEVYLGGLCNIFFFRVPRKSIRMSF